ncbi:hypothetical protein [Glutamicibacter ardleyensis]|uniref:hypothetical protein n=1 Tax=Glutamicibacter ardleyensis TaxID=225894 RepID=UPI003FCF5860
MGSQSAGQVWRGTVTRVLDDGLVWVVVPQLMGSEPLGPMPSHGSTSVGAGVLVVMLGGSRQTMIAVPDPDERFAEVDATLGVIRAPANAWVAAAAPNQPAVSHEWDPNYGWVSWIDLAALAVVGDALFTFPYQAGIAAVARPYGWEMTVLTSGVSGVTGLRPRVDYMSGATIIGANAQLSLAGWTNWAYRVEHDFILPANTSARPTFLALGVTASSVGRIGLTAPKLATKSERSQ